MCVAFNLGVSPTCPLQDSFRTGNIRLILNPSRKMQCVWEQSQFATLLISVVNWSGAPGRCHLADLTAKCAAALYNTPPSPSLKCAAGNSFVALSYSPRHLLSRKTCLRLCCIKVKCPKWPVNRSFVTQKFCVWFYCVSLCHVNIQRPNTWQGQPPQNNETQK